MGIQVFPVPTGTDWSKYNPFFLDQVFTTSATAGTYTTALSVSGKGFLNHAHISSHATNTRYIRITLDGVVVFWTSIIGSNLQAGLMDYNGITSNAAPLQVKAGSLVAGSPIAGTIGNYPSASQQTNSAVILTGQIPFKSSCLVEVASSAASDSPGVNAQGRVI